MDRNLKTSLGVALSNNLEYKDPILRQVVNQTVEQSGLNSNQRVDIMKKINPMIASDNLTGIFKTFDEYNLNKRFSKNVRWMTGNSGQNFISNVLPELATISPDVSSLVFNRTKINLVEDPSSLVKNIMNKTQKGFASAFNVPLNDVSVSYQGARANFYAAGFGGSQSSELIMLNINANNMSFSLPIHKPSEHGLLANINIGRSGISGGSSIYNTAATYFTDATGAGSNFNANMIHGHFDFQLRMVEQIQERIHDLRLSGASQKEINNAVKQLTNKFAEQASSSQFFIGNSGQLADISSSQFQASRFSEGIEGKARLQGQVAVWADDLSRNPVKQGSIDPYVFMNQSGYGHFGSSGQAGKRSAYPSSIASNAPIMRLPHQEPMKPVGNFSHLTRKNLGQSLIPANVDMYPELHGANPVSERIRGVQLSATLLPPNMKDSNMFIPEGVGLIDEMAYKQGYLNVGENASYRIKVTGPTGAEGAQVNKLIKTLMEGGEITSAKGKKFQIPGFRNANLNVQTSSMADVLGMAPSEMAEHFPKGIPLHRNMYLGINPGTKRAEYTPNYRHITEHLTEINVGSNQNEIMLNVNRTTGPLIDSDGKVIPHSIKAVERYKGIEGASIKSEGEMITRKQAINLYKEAGYSNKNARIAAAGGYKLEASTLKDPGKRLIMQADAMRVELDRLVRTGTLKGEKQEIARRMIMTNGDDILSQISQGVLAQNFGISTESAQAKIMMSSLENKVSMNQKLAAVSKFLLSDVGDKEQIRALSNIFAPHTKFGKAHGLEPADITSRYFTFHGQARPLNAASEGLIEYNARRELLSAGFNSHVVDSALASDTPMKTLARFSIRDQGVNLGTGIRGSIEPRFFDTAFVNPELQPVFKEMSSRITDLTPVMRKIESSVKGLAPKGAQVFDLNNSLKQLGNADFVSSLGSFNETAIQQRISEISPNSKAVFRNNLFVPGGEEISAMGQMTTGAGSIKSKPARQIYEDYLNQVKKAKRMTSSRQIDAIANATINFNNQIGEMFKQQFYGVAGGQGHGLLRAPIKGSAYVQAKGMGMNFMEMMGYMPPTEINPDDFVSQRKAIQAAIDAEGIGRQGVASTSQLDKMYRDAMRHAEELGNTKKLLQLKQQRANLAAGKSVLMPMMRNPGIGPRSITPIRIWEDAWSRSSEELDYIRVSTEHYKDPAITNAKGEAKLLLTSLAEDLNLDHDGDRPVITMVTEEKAIKGLQNIMNDSHGHAVRYNRIKDVAIQTIQKAANQKQGSFLADLISPEAAEYVRSSYAHAAPDQIVPKISNAFTDMKFMIGRSSLSESAKADLYSFFQAAEQVPISGKRLVNTMSQANHIVQEVGRARIAMVGNAEQRVAAADSLLNLYMDKDIVNQMNQKGTMIHGVNAEISRENVRSNLIKVFNEFNENENTKKFAEMFRRNSMGKNLSALERIEIMAAEQPNLKKYHAHSEVVMSNAAKKNFRNVSEFAMSGINQATEAAGKVGGSHLPSKNIMAVAAIAAAGVLAASTVSMTLGPTVLKGASGGEHLNADYLFPDEVDQRQKFLHSGNFPSPVSGSLINPSYRATIHMPPGVYSDAGLSGRIGSISSMMGGAISQMNWFDNRMNIDAHTISKIKNELI